MSSHNISTHKFNTTYFMNMQRDKNKIKETKTKTNTIKSLIIKKVIGVLF